MRFTLDDWLKLAQDNKHVIITLDGVELHSNVAAADDVEGWVDHLVTEGPPGQAPYVERTHGVVTIRVIEPLGVMVAETITAKERL